MPLFQYAGFELISISGCPNIGVHRHDHGESQDIDGFLMKPVDKTKMLKTVRKVLDEAKKKR